MACLTNEEIQNIIGGVSCNNFDPLVDLVEEINERACAGCLGIVPAGTSVSDFLTIALSPEGGLAFDPVNPDCDEIWVKETDTDNRYVSLDDGLTWCQVCNGFCFAPETIPDGTALEDILDEGWGNGTAGSGLLAIPDSANCSVLVALVGCDVCFAVNNSIDCDLGNGTSGTGTDWHCFSTAGGSVLMNVNLTFGEVIGAGTTSTLPYNHTLSSNPNNLVSSPALAATDTEFTLRSGTYQYQIHASAKYSGGLDDLPIHNNGGSISTHLYNITDSAIIASSSVVSNITAVSTGESVPSPILYNGQFVITSAKRIRMRGTMTLTGPSADNWTGTSFGTLSLTRIG